MIGMRGAAMAVGAVTTLLMLIVVLATTGYAGSENAEEPAPGEVPAQELGEGTGRVDLRLVSATSGEPVSGRARLWRLDLPASADWSAGDQIQWAGEVPDSGVTVDGLPQGRYRAEATSQGRRHADPEPFEVRSKTVTVSVPVAALARRVPVRLRIFRPGGEEEREATSASWYAHSWARPWVPQWAHPREALGEGATPWEPSNAGTGGSGAMRALRRDDAGFVLDGAEVPRDADSTIGKFVTCDAREFWASQHIQVPFTEIGPDRTNMVAFLPSNPDRLLENVRTTDGRAPRPYDVDDSGHVVPRDVPGDWFDVESMMCLSVAVAVRPEDGPQAWRHAPVRVLLRIRGVDRWFRFEWTVATADEERVLR